MSWYLVKGANRYDKDARESKEDKNESLSLSFPLHFTGK